MRIYEAMRKLDPDFFIHSGDTIYADGPIAAQVSSADGACGATSSPKRRAKWPKR